MKKLLAKLPESWQTPHKNEFQSGKNFRKNDDVHIKNRPLKFLLPCFSDSRFSKGLLHVLKKTVTITALILACVFVFVACNKSTIEVPAQAPNLDVSENKVVSQEEASKIDSQAVDKLMGGMEENTPEEEPSASEKPKFTDEELKAFEGYILEDVYPEKEATKAMKENLAAQNQNVFSDGYVKVNENDLDLYLVVTQTEGITQEVFDECMSIYKNSFENMFAQKLALIPANLKMTLLDENDKVLFSGSTVLDVENMKKIINDPSRQINVDEKFKKTAQEYVDFYNTDETREMQNKLLPKGMSGKWLLEGNNIVYEVSFGNDLGLTKKDFDVTDEAKEKMLAIAMSEIKASVKDAQKYSIEYRYVNADTNEVLSSIKGEVG